jgi:flagellar biosynthesis GTPase FlhF
MNNELITKLDAFIRKYYKNQLIRGVIWVFTGVLSAFVLTSLLEYLGHFSSAVRAVLFFSFIGLSIFIGVRFFVLPLLKLYKLGKTINYEQAAQIIGSHFSHVQDKLLNTLQLDAEHDGSALMRAAIRQKTEELKPVPFQSAIDLKKNLKYLKYALVPVLVLGAILLIAPGFKDSPKRLINYNQDFVLEAPFQFQLLNDDLNVNENEDFVVDLELMGKTIPTEVDITFNGFKYRMNPNGKARFKYQFTQAAQDVSFRFEADGYSSELYQLNVVQKPTLLSFQAYLDYPAYTGMKDEKVSNTTNYIVPQGTNIQWEISGKHVDDLVFVLPGNKRQSAPRKKTVFTFVKRFLGSEALKVTSRNAQEAEGDSMELGVQVIADRYPTIEVKEKKDSFSKKIKYLMGKVSDDYGFSKLVFKYRFTESDSAQKVTEDYEMVPMTLSKSKSQSFYHLWDLNTIGVQPNDKVEYFFEVWDNDGVQGAKKTRSQAQVFAAPSLDEINKEAEKRTENLKNELAENAKSMEDMEKEMLELEKQLTERKTLSWEDKKKIKDMLKKHEELQKNLKEIVEENKQNNQQQEEFNELDQSIKEKQEQIEKLMDEVMNDEMKELMDKIQELMEKNQKNQLMNKLDELKLSDQQLNKQLDRMMEQLKQLQLEKKVNETVDKLNKLADEQMKLSEETKKDETSKEDLIKKQEELQKKYDEVKKDLEDINKKNKELEKPLNLDTKKDQESQEKTDQEQNESKQNLQKNKKSPASQNQKNAADEMKKQAQSLNSQMQMAMQQQQQEDYNTLREILENLIQVSKDQEEIMAGFKAIRSYNPKYIELGQRQKKLRDDTRLIEDSLTALSKRNQAVEHFINKEMGKVNYNLDKTMAYLGERQTARVLVHEQYVMTSLNNLALMLSSSLEQMQQQMQQQKKQGDGSCNKPGQGQQKQGSPKMDGMQKMQQSLKKMMEEMQKGMQQGGQKPGSKSFAEAAAMQSAIRKKLRDLQKQLEKEGNGQMSKELTKTQELMDETERQLYNKEINPDMIKRQQEILTRLLEHEKALREQEKDNKRKSNEGKDEPREVPPSIQEYLKQKEKEEELLKTLPPDLSPYYEQKVRMYFEQLGQ